MNTCRMAIFLGAAAAAVLALAGCGNKPAPKPAPARVAPVAPVVIEPGIAFKDEFFGPAPPAISEPYRIRTDDIIEIGVWGEADMTRKVKVGPDGRISYFQATSLLAAGKTLSELKAELTEKMKGYFKHPEVFVSLEDSAGHYVSVIGVVKSPGNYKINNETRLMDIVAQAGGIPLASNVLGTRTEEVADLSNAFVLRGEQFLDVDFAKLFSGSSGIDPREIAANNVRLQAGDRIFIPSAVKLENKVYVVGAVRAPQLITYSKEISFLEAIIRAGDVFQGSWERNSFIIRGRMKKPEIIAVNTREVRTGKVPDIALQPGDVIYMPKTPLFTASEVVAQFGTIFTGVTQAEAAYKVRFDRN